jgi:hypothetical protein
MRVHRLVSAADDHVLLLGIHSQNMFDPVKMQPRNMHSNTRPVFDADRGLLLIWLRTVEHLLEFIPHRIKLLPFLVGTDVQSTGQDRY